MCKISVIVTVYNKEKYLEQFLESIKKQQLQDIEVIIVDDGSSDACPQILDEFAGKDERYKVIHQPNRGVCDARNNALSYAGIYCNLDSAQELIVELEVKAGSGKECEEQVSRRSENTTCGDSQYRKDDNRGNDYPVHYNTSN